MTATSTSPTARHLVSVPETADTVGAVESAGTEAAPRSLTLISGGISGVARALKAVGTTLIAAVLIGVIGALIVQATMIESQRDLDALRSQIQELEGETEAMRHELAELEAPARIVAEARDLGMIDAPSVAYLTIPAGPLDDATLSVAESQLLNG